jgi:hypothetical protein
MGRPALEEEQKRVVQVNIRLTIGENKKVEAYAQSAGLSPANWIRQKVFTGRFPTIKNSPIEAALYLELHKIGVNLNQAVRRINTVKTGVVPQPILEQLLAMQQEIIKRLLP